MFTALLITLFGSTVLACTVMPFVYSWLLDFYSGFPWPFSRVFDRVFLLFLVLFIFYFRQQYNLSSIKRSLLQPKRIRHRVELLLYGVCISSLSVVVCIVGVFVSGHLALNPRSVPELCIKMLVVLPGALLIAFFEELFFRILMLGRLRDYFSPLAAVVISGLVYAVAHFITPEKTFVFQGRSNGEGFMYLNALISRLAQPGTALGIAGLLVIGVILGVVRCRYRSVYLLIGLHAGWIFSLKMISFISLRSPLLVYPAGLSGRYALFNEPLTWLSFMLVSIAIFGAERLGLLRYADED